ncbi:MAG: M15 family metallopeptidase [Pseudomonadota bacterium]
MKKLLPLLIFLFCKVSFSEQSPIPKNFVSLADIIPDIVIDMRYYNNNNFVGKPIDGYEANKCLLQEEVAFALKRVQEALKKQSYGLKVYDCYRPQSAVDHFMTWVQIPEDSQNKKQYYPREEKSQLVERGYIARRSGHSRGNTVDLTLIRRFSETSNTASVSMNTKSIDMGTSYDYFDVLSHTNSPEITLQQRKNRLRLKHIMEAHGFRNYSYEWWHYSYSHKNKEKTYHNFPVR